jgi:hypothetical protein
MLNAPTGQKMMQFSHKVQRSGLTESPEVKSSKAPCGQTATHPPHSPQSFLSILTISF